METGWKPVLRFLSSGIAKNGDILPSGGKSGLRSLANLSSCRNRPGFRSVIGAQQMNIYSEIIQK